MRVLIIFMLLCSALSLPRKKNTKTLLIETMDKKADDQVSTSLQILISHSFRAFCVSSIRQWNTGPIMEAPRTKKRRKISAWSEQTQEFNDISIDDNTVRIKGCATMWHETEEEIEEMLKSIFRIDEDYCARKLAFKMQDVTDDYYEWESHIFFDDCMMTSSDVQVSLFVEFTMRFTSLLSGRANSEHVCGGPGQLRREVWQEMVRQEEARRGRSCQDGDSIRRTDHLDSAGGDKDHLPSQGQKQNTT